MSNVLISNYVPAHRYDTIVNSGFQENNQINLNKVKMLECHHFLVQFGHSYNNEYIDSAEPRFRRVVSSA